METDQPRIMGHVLSVPIPPQDEDEARHAFYLVKAIDAAGANDLDEDIYDSSAVRHITVATLRAAHSHPIKSFSFRRSCRAALKRLFQKNIMTRTQRRDYILEVSHYTHGDHDPLVQKEAITLLRILDEETPRHAPAAKSASRPPHPAAYVSQTIGLFH